MCSVNVFCECALIRVISPGHNLQGKERGWLGVHPRKGKG